MPWVLQFARGGALAGLIGTVALAIALLAGLTPGTSLLVFPFAAGAGVVYALIPARAAVPQLLGGLAVGMLALGSGLITGFGAVEGSLSVGAAVALLFRSREPGRIPRVSPIRLGVLVLVIAVANLLPLVLDGGGLGHDESAYAVKARYWAEGTPQTGWNLHRGIAMSGYGYLVFAGGGDEASLRLLGLAAVVGFAIATWVLGSRIGGPWVGPLSAIALVSSPALLRRSTEYLSDVPSASLLVACMVVVWKEFSEREAPGYRLMWLLPFAWAAFYIRYQAVLSFALIAVAVGVLFRDKVKLAWRPILATAGVGFVGLVPHFVFASAETGSPLGILLFTADVAGREFYGEGLIDYFLLMGWPLAAFVGPFAVVLFIWWLVADWEDLGERTKCLFLMIPAAGQVLVLGVLSHGEARFVFFPLALTLIGGIIGLRTLMRRWRPSLARAVRLGLVILLLGSLAMSAAYVRRSVDNRTVGTAPIVTAAEQMRESSGEESCGVMTSYLPQITFYSACETQSFRTHLEPEDALARVRGEHRFMLLVDGGKRQPSGDHLDALLALTTGELSRIDGERNSVSVYRFGSGF